MYAAGLAYACQLVCAVTTLLLFILYVNTCHLLVDYVGQVLLPRMPAPFMPLRVCWRWLFV